MIYLKKILLILNLLFFFGINLFAQEVEWKKINDTDRSIYKDLVEDIQGNFYFHTDYKMFKSTDYGFTWQDCTPQIELPNFKILTADKNGRLYTSVLSGSNSYPYYQTNFTLVSSDGGSSWNNTTGTSQIQKFTFDSSGNAWGVNKITYMDGGWSKVIKLPKGSTNWIQVKDLGQTSYAFCIFVDNKNNILVTASGYDDSYSYKHFLWCSSDNGNSWNKAAFNETQYLITDITSDIKQSANGYLFMVNQSNAPGNIIFRSKDGGNSWESISKSANAPADIQAIVIDKNDRIIVGTLSQGVLYSKDYGNSWHAMNSGLKTDQITTLLISKDGYIYAGVNSGGLYKSTEPLNIKDENPDPDTPKDLSFTLFQNFPNPFNPVTTIKYIVSDKSFVELKVYDMLGHEVTTLVSKEQDAGEYSIEFNASSLPSRIYIYTIQAGEFRDSKKFILLK